MNTFVKMLNTIRVILIYVNIDTEVSFHVTTLSWEASLRAVKDQRYGKMDLPGVAF